MNGADFVILIGNQACQETVVGRARSAGMEPVLRWPELVIIAEASGLPSLTVEGANILIGNAFQKNADVQNMIGADICSRKAEPRNILHEYWGDYIFVRVREGCVSIYRSPSISCRAFWHSTDGGCVVTSNARLFSKLGIIVPSIDWRHCAHRLRTGMYPHIRTAIEGVEELLPGFRIDVTTRSNEAEPWWSPWDHVDDLSDGVARYEETRLASIVDSCVAAATKPFDELLVRVSGGLDSSIVASSAVASGKPVRLVTMVGGVGDGDERYYANLLADHLRVPISALHYEVRAFDITRPSHPSLPFPHGRGLGYPIAQLCEAQVCPGGSTGILTGFGGDGIFSFQQTARPITDRCRAEGVGGGLFSTMLDICRMTDASLPQVTVAAARQLWRDRRKRRRRHDDSFLNPSLLDEEPEALTFPWSEAPNAVLPGKLEHVGMLVSGYSYAPIEFSNVSITEIVPLLAQPVVEYCLAAPSWVWCRGGKDRALARQAFGSRLPAELIERQTKGGPGAFLSRVVNDKVIQIREHLLDGCLARQGVIARENVEATLASYHTMTVKESVRILEFCDAEGWARSWQS